MLGVRMSLTDQIRLCGVRLPTKYGCAAGEISSALWASHSKKSHFTSDAGFIDTARPTAPKLPTPLLGRWLPTATNLKLRQAAQIIQSRKIRSCISYYGRARWTKAVRRLKKCVGRFSFFLPSTFRHVVLWNVQSWCFPSLWYVARNPHWSQTTSA